MGRGKERGNVGEVGGFTQRSGGRRPTRKQAAGACPPTPREGVAAPTATPQALTCHLPPQFVTSPLAPSAHNCRHIPYPRGWGGRAR